MPERVLIMGLGSFGGGEGAARYFAQRGDHVTVTDLRSAEALAAPLARLADLPAVRYVLGRHDEADFLTADRLVVSPAVPDADRLTALSRSRGVAIDTEMGLFLERCPAPVLAITGSNGKSTTTRLLHALLDAAGLRPYLAGNIGISLLPVVDDLDPLRPVVLEISSFQLARLAGRDPLFRGAILTNLTPNHLDRHPDFAAYARAKAVVFERLERQGVGVFNADDPESKGIAARFPEALGVSSAEADAGVPALSFLPGPTNRMNFLQALTLARRFTGDPLVAAAAHVAASFRGIEHRLEVFAERSGVLFVNDSKATTPEATHAAVGAFDRPIHLIAGGYDKGLAADLLLTDFSRCRSVHLIGATAGRLAELFRARGGRAFVHDSLDAAVAEAAAAAQPDDVVLLSPAHPSYGLFSDYRARGRAFRSRVIALGQVACFPPALSETGD